MADKKTVPGYSGTLDMQDPESIRAYVRDCLAMSIDPSVAGLKRLEMLEEHAAKLEAKASKPAELRLIDPKAAAEELARRQQALYRNAMLGVEGLTGAVAADE